MADISVSLRSMTPDDGPVVLALYQQGIATGHASFEETAPHWQEWDQSHLSHSRIIAQQGEEIVGWAALSSVSGRCVYGGVAEVSVYLSDAARGHGIGSKLMEALVKDSEREGLWMLQAGIFPENDASVALHRKHGFRTVGTREKLGRMSFGPMEGQWRDVLLLERRSGVVGKR